MPVSIRRQANGEIPPRPFHLYADTSAVLYHFQAFIIRMISCFFSNLDSASWLSDLTLFKTVTLPLFCILPKDGNGAWRNQFYLYDILRCWRKGCKRTIRCSSAMRTVSVCSPLEQLFRRIITEIRFRPVRCIRLTGPQRERNHTKGDDRYL